MKDLASPLLVGLAIGLFILGIGFLYSNDEDAEPEPMPSTSTNVQIYYQGERDTIYILKRPIIKIDFGITEFGVTVLKNDKLEKQTWIITLEKKQNHSYPELGEQDD